MTENRERIVHFACRQLWPLGVTGRLWGVNDLVTSGKAYERRAGRVT